MESMDFELVETDVCVPMDVDTVPEYIILSEIQSVRSVLQEPPTASTSTPTAASVRSDHKRGTLFIILDTNVLLGHLNFIVELRDSMLPTQRPTLVLPWVVIQELDGLKESDMVGRQANKAVKFIHACVADGHPRVRVQRSDEERSDKSLRIECNDDRILECCLYFQSVVAGQGSLVGSVVLFTNDVNLSVKSMVHNIQTFSRQTILSGLKQLKPRASNMTHKQLETSPSTLNHDSDLSEPPAKRGCHGDSSKVAQSGNTPSQSSERGSCAKHSRAGMKRKRPHGSPQSTFSREIPTAQLKRPLGKVKEAIIPKFSDDSVYCQASAILRDALAYCIEEHMVKIYEEMWLTIVAIKPPWTLRDCLFLLNKHWVAVFGFVLPRDGQRWVGILQDLVKKSDSKCLSHLQTNCFVDSSREVIKMFMKEASQPERLKEFDSKLGVMVTNC